MLVHAQGVPYSSSLRTKEPPGAGGFPQARNRQNSGSAAVTSKQEGLAPEDKSSMTSRNIEIETKESLRCIEAEYHAKLKVAEEKARLIEQVLRVLMPT